MKKCLLFAMMLFAFAFTTQAANEVTADCGDVVTLTATPNTGHYFVRWNDNNTDNPRLVEVTGDATYTAFFAPIKYTITFVNWDDSQLYQGLFDYGTTPSYGGSTPVRPADAQYTYTFDGWDPNIHPVTGDETYKAVYTYTINKYTVTYKNWDGTVLQSSEVAYGEMPHYNGTTPTRPSTAQYTYTFKGWDKAETAVTGDVEYIAQYDATVNKYTITFNNWDGTTLATYELEYGQMPAYAGTTPTRPATAQYTYTFSGWTPSIVAVTGNATYTATYDAEVNSYTITLHAVNGTVTGAGTYTYGTSVKIVATPEECYHFVNWSDGDTNATRNIIVTGDIELTAYCEVNTYTIRVESADPTQGTASVSL